MTIQSKLIKISLIAALSVLLPSCAMNAQEVAQATTLANQGDAKAQKDLMKHYDRQGDHANALHWAKLLATKNDRDAHLLLAQAYELGKGTARNGALALQHYGKAAENGSTQALLELARLYKDGTIVGRNDVKAFEWTELAARRGNSQARYQLGEMYYQGIGTTKDYFKAFEQFKKSYGDDARRRVAQMHYHGVGTRQDYKAAMEIFEKLSDKKDGEAQYYLGTMYEYGRGVRHDLNLAKEWYGKACDNKSQNGCTGYKRVSDPYYYYR